MAEETPKESRPPPLSLPKQDTEAKNLAETANIKTFFKVWDKLLSSDLAETDDTAEESTIVTIEDFGFTMLIPMDAANPLYLDDVFQRLVIACQLVKGRVDPDNEEIKKEKGLKTTTVGGRTLVFKNEGMMTVNDMPVVSVHRTAKTSIFVLQNVLFIRPEDVSAGISRAYNNSPVKYDPWGRPM